jgi:hypothetical protein
MSRDYRVQFWGAVLGGPPLIFFVGLGLTFHHRRTRKAVTR